MRPFTNEGKQNTSKFGVGIMVESADPELMEAQQQAAQVVA